MASSKMRNPRRPSRFTPRRRVLIGMWSLWFAYLSLTSESVPSVAAAQGSKNLVGGESYTNLKRFHAPESLSLSKGPLLLSTDYVYEDLDEYDLVDGFNCTFPAILDFPSDLFNQAQRQGGAIVVHFLVSIYIFYAIAIVCDDYFVPAIESICGEMKLPTDVAGASFMAIATSAPELFTNVIGTFITQGDIGVGTIVGSAVFNILAVCACCGFAAKMALPLDWYPLTRDCLFYLLSVILLIVMLQDERIYVYEAIILVLVYFVYILVMWKNSALKGMADNFVSKFGYNPRGIRVKDMDSEAMEKTPLLGGVESSGQRFSQDPNDEVFVTREDYEDMLLAKALHQTHEAVEDDGDKYGLCKPPRGESCGVWLEWILGWPTRLVFLLTIPDCRTKRFRAWYPLTFIMCIVYIALLSYVVSWIVTVIGFTFQIPDSVMGLTFIAAGTSVPEAVSSIIVARQGLGSMGISNSIGSNTFDILICLGVPWLIKAAMLVGSEVDFVQINSTGLEYSTIMLLTSLLLFYFIILCNKFYLDKKVAVAALLMYCLFLVFATLFELNVFFPVNLPTCQIPGSV